MPSRDHRKLRIQLQAALRPAPSLATRAVETSPPFTGRPARCLAWESLLASWRLCHPPTATDPSETSTTARELEIGQLYTLDEAAARCSMSQEQLLAAGRLGRIELCVLPDLWMGILVVRENEHYFHHEDHDEAEPLVGPYRISRTAIAQLVTASQKNEPISVMALEPPRRIPGRDHVPDETGAVWWFELRHEHAVYVHDLVVRPEELDAFMDRFGSPASAVRSAVGVDLSDEPLDKSNEVDQHHETAPNGDDPEPETKLLPPETVDTTQPSQSAAKNRRRKIMAALLAKMYCELADKYERGPKGQNLLVRENETLNIHQLSKEILSRVDSKYGYGEAPLNRLLSESKNPDRPIEPVVCRLLCELCDQEEEAAPEQ